MNPKTVKVAFNTNRLLPMLINTLGTSTLPDWVITSATVEQVAFLSRRPWSVEYSYQDRTVYLIIEIQNDSEATLANIYFG